jgi:hypothetical protein
VEVKRSTRLDPRTNPISVENSSQLTRKPLRSSGEYSARNVEAPPNSPPAEKPCKHRATTSRMGAAMPMVA